MKKRKKLLWKSYIKQTVLTLTITVASSWLIFKAIDSFTVGNPKQSAQSSRSAAETRADSLQMVLKSLSPEKLSKIKALYEDTYAFSEPDAKLGSSENPGAESNRGPTLSVSDWPIFNELKKIDIGIEWRKMGYVAINNDTVYIQDRDTLALGIEYGCAYNNVPQIDIHYFKYDGDIEALKKIAEQHNSYEFRTEIVCHEIRHADNFRHIIRVPKEQRTRAVAAADELFATIAGNLSDYAEMGPESKGWNKSFRQKISVWDVDYKLPENSRPIIDSAITSALDALEGQHSYRKRFIDREGYEYHHLIEERYGAKIRTAADAVFMMRHGLKINGKLTDIFSLASEKVRRRANDFINSNDDDMRLVIGLHDNNVKFFNPPVFILSNLFKPAHTETKN
ncbi:MAG: hypothetical protein LBJ73_00865 [Rickettsiales bacterium]|nr:hypothetical protein [Rickettsiales bacterium]